MSKVELCDRTRSHFEAHALELAALLQVEDETHYLELQSFFSCVHRLTRERRLSRFVYMARNHRPG